jgi:hypothetical protein
MASIPSSFFSTFTCAEATTVTPPPRPQKRESYGTPAPRLLLAGLADAYGTTMGVAGDNDFMTHEDQLLVAVEAGRVVRGGSVSVRLAGGRRHRPQRWCGGCPLCFECVSDFSRRLAGFRGLQEARDDTAAALCKDTKTGLATTKLESYGLDGRRQPWAGAGPNKSTVGRREADELIAGAPGVSDSCCCA